MVIRLKQAVRNHPLITLSVLAFFSVMIAHLLKSKHPETRAHVALTNIIKSWTPECITLLDYYPTFGVEEALVDSLAMYIYEATNQTLSRDKAESRAKSFILWSVLFDVPLDMIVWHAQCESNFWTEWLWETTHNALNIGNTDAGWTRIFTSFELGTLSAVANLAWRIYCYKQMFPERKTLDYTSLWLNQDQETWVWFLPDQLNYKKNNPKRSTSLNPYGAYMSDAKGPERIYEKIAQLSFIDTTYRVQEWVSDWTHWMFYYEKSVPVDNKVYHSFSYVTVWWESVGDMRKKLAAHLGIPEKEITIMPYDHSRDNFSEENKITPRAWKLLYGLYITPQ